MRDRYRWFRVYSADILHDRKFRGVPAGEVTMPFLAVYKYLWFVILCLANDSPIRGELWLGQRLPLTPEDIAVEAQVPEAVVKQALDFFCRRDMLHVLETEFGTVYIVTHWQERQYDYPSDYPEASRERKRRWLQRQKQGNGEAVESTSGSELPEASTSQEGEVDDTIARLVRLFENEMGRLLTPLEYGYIGDMAREHPEEVIAEAVRRAVAQGKRNFAYIQGILHNWRGLGLRTIHEILEYEEQYKNGKSKKDGAAEEAAAAAKKVKEKAKKFESDVKAAIAFAQLRFKDGDVNEDELRNYLLADGYSQKVVDEVVKRWNAQETS